MNILRRSFYFFANNVSKNTVPSNIRLVYSANQSIPSQVLCNNVNLELCRHYSKGKDKGKDKKKTMTKVDVDYNQLKKFLDMDSVKDEYEGILNTTMEEFTTTLSLRSSVGAIETIKINHEGKNYELQEVAQIIRKNPKTVVLNMASIPQIIPDVIKAIGSSGLNLNPQQDGTTVYIPVPKITKEHRENLAKNAKVIYNKYKLEMKQIPLKCFRKLKIADKNLSEDTHFMIKKQINTMCDTYVEKLKDVYTKKSSELLGN